MAEGWSVMPGIGAAGGGGPVAGTVTNFQITRSDGSTLSAIFAGVGVTIGGPASFTYSDRETTGYRGQLVWAPGRQDNEILLRNPPSGLIMSVGTAPRYTASCV